MKQINWTEPRFSMKQLIILLIGTVIFATVLTIADYLL